MEIKEGLTIKKKDFAAKRINFVEHIDCQFIDCSFENGDLSNSVFTDCEFHGCDLSNLLLKNTTLNHCEFIQCKLLGLNFSECNDFLLSMNFKRSLLDHSLFVGVKLKSTEFVQCSVKGVDFTSADLTGVNFEESNLESARFDYTVLEKGDFRTAFNFRIDPELNRVKGARFSSQGLSGLLDKYQIEID